MGATLGAAKLPPFAFKLPKWSQGYAKDVMEAFEKDIFSYVSGRHIIVYADKCLNRQLMLKLAKAFDLAANQMNLARDEHYQCASCNLDFLE